MIFLPPGLLSRLPLSSSPLRASVRRISALVLFSSVSMVCSADELPDVGTNIAAAAVRPPPTVTLDEASSLDPSFEAPEALWTALAERKHSTAVAQLAALDRQTLPGRAVADVAFLEAWSLLRADRGAEAVTLIEVIKRAEIAPPAYIQLTVGELLLEAGRPVEAIAALDAVPSDAAIAVRAQLRQAEALHEAGQTRASQELYEELAARPDPADGMPQVLWALANRVGLSSPEAYPHLRRLWAMYPRSSEGYKADRQLPVHEGRGSRYRASSLEIAQRADALMGGWAFEQANDLISANMSRFSEPNEASCIAWYVHGRSHFKRNNVTLAASVLAPAGRKCAGIDEDRGAKSLYIAGKSLERKKQWANAAAAYQDIPRLYPDHSMADDGYTLAGIGLQESGDLGQAMSLWAAQVAAYPDGDLAAEGFWRLAWSSYKQGDPAAAIRWAEQMSWTVPIESDPVHVMAGHYWAARWKLYPDISDPSRLSTDTASVEEGIKDLLALCREHPTRFYSLLAAARLYELAPDALAEIERPVFSGAVGQWTLDVELAERPAMQRSMALARLGLVQESIDELSLIPGDEQGPTGAAIRARVEGRRDWVVAHDRLHKYLLHHPPSTYFANQLPILQTAFPDHYWDLVQEAADGYGFDPRVFHSLVREESSFNKDIVSWAGARGLSQLMPATAKQVGGWLGIAVTKQSSFDPLTNLRIGSRYMEYLQARFKGNMFLAVGGYNAGEGNIDRWLRERGNRPTDEFIENIPFRETRGYVKRVLGTYQMYHVLYDDSPLFIDWSDYNHLAKRSSG
ncbi:MAG: soluble lytic murein transglycosylase [Myxococcota bacterium]|jgi:soluble lytic murein transglycosylase